MFSFLEELFPVKKPLVFVVDDDQDIRHLLATWLDKNGCSVRSFEDGTAVLKVIQLGEKPDLIFLDIMMPHQDGFEVCSEIRRNSELRKTPVIFITARHGDLDYQRAHAVGATSYVEKPFRWEVLEEILNRYLDIPQAEQFSHEKDGETEQSFSRLLMLLRVVLTVILFGVVWDGAGQNPQAFSTAAAVSAVHVLSQWLVPVLWRCFGGKAPLLAAVYLYDIVSAGVVFALMPGASNALFLVFFLLCLLSCIFRRLEWVLVSSVLGSFAYAVFNYGTEFWSRSWRSYEILQFPFIVLVSTFTGYLADHARRRSEQQRKLSELTSALTRHADTATHKLVSATRNLKAMVEYHRQVLASLPIAVIVVRHDGRIQTCNTEASRILRIPSENLLQRSLPDLPGNLENIRNWLEQGLREDKESVIERFPLKVADGEENAVFVSVRIAPLRGSDGKKLGAILMLQDQTMMMQLENKAAHQERLAVLGRMAAGLAHEIRNPLNVIQGFSKRLLEQSQDEKSRRAAQMIFEESKRLENLLQDVLEYGRATVLDLKRENLIEVIQEVLNFLHDKCERHHIRVQLSSMLEKPWIWCDREKIKQVFLNLFLNALQAMPEGGMLDIRLDLLATMEPAKTEQGRVDAGRYWKVPAIRVRVRDTGHGIPRENLSKIFEAFFTTKRSGTGLGLSLCAKIIQDHEGVISASSEEGKGTEFQILFPWREERS